MTVLSLLFKCVSSFLPKRVRPSARPSVRPSLSHESKIQEIRSTGWILTEQDHEHEPKLKSKEAVQHYVIWKEKGKPWWKSNGTEFQRERERERERDNGGIMAGNLEQKGGKKAERLWGGRLNGPTERWRDGTHTVHMLPDSFVYQLQKKEQTKTHAFSL